MNSSESGNEFYVAGGSRYQGYFIGEQQQRTSGKFPRNQGLQGLKPTDIGWNDRLY